MQTDSIVNASMQLKGLGNADAEHRADADEHVDADVDAVRMHKKTTTRL